MRTLLALIVLAAALRAGAEEPPVHAALQDRFWFGVGVYSPKTSTSAQFDSNRVGAGTDVDFERALGMASDKTVPVALLRFRLGERWRIEGEYFELKRTGERAINQNIQWGDTVYPVNSQVSSSFDFYDLRTSVGYSFFKRTDKELGVGLGLHVAGYRVSLTSNAIGTESEDVTAPLPVLSFYGQFALTEHWALAARFDWLSMSYDKYDGSLTAQGLDIMYQPFRNVGVGLGYRSLFLNLRVAGDRGTLRFEQSFQGPVFFLYASF